VPISGYPGAPGRLRECTGAMRAATDCSVGRCVCFCPAAPAPPRPRSVPGLMDAHGALAPNHVSPGDALVAIDDSPVAAAPTPAAVFALLAGAAGTLVTLEFRDASTARRYRVVAQRHAPLDSEAKDSSYPLSKSSLAGQNGTIGTYDAAGRGSTAWDAGMDRDPCVWAASRQSYAPLPKGSPASKKVELLSGWSPSASATAGSESGPASPSRGDYLDRTEISLRGAANRWSELSPVLLNSTGARGQFWTQAGLNPAWVTPPRADSRKRAAAAGEHVTQL
jgi:hypothetical protein